MNLLNKLTKKNLILNKKRTIVTVIGIILSVAFFSDTARSINFIVNHLLLKYYAVIISVILSIKLLSPINDNPITS